MKQILLVEDDPAHTLLIKTALMEFNGSFEITSVETGWDALEKLKQEPFDLIILDLNMPKMNGFEFLEAKRDLPKPLNFVPVIVLTTSPLKRDIHLAYELGAAAYVVKPAEYKDIRVMAGYLLGFYQMTKLPTGEGQ